MLFDGAESAHLWPKVRNSAAPAVAAPAWSLVCRTPAQHAWQPTPGSHASACIGPVRLFVCGQRRLAWRGPRRSASLGRSRTRSRWTRRRWYRAAWCGGRLWQTLVNRALTRRAARAPWLADALVARGQCTRQPGDLLCSVCGPRECRDGRGGCRRVTGWTAASARRGGGARRGAAGGACRCARFAANPGPAACAVCPVDRNLKPPRSPCCWP